MVNVTRVAQRGFSNLSTLTPKFADAQAFNKVLGNLNLRPGTFTKPTLPRSPINSPTDVGFDQFQRNLDSVVNDLPDGFDTTQLKRLALDAPEGTLEDFLKAIGKQPDEIANIAASLRRGAGLIDETLLKARAAGNNVEKSTDLLTTLKYGPDSPNKFTNTEVIDNLGDLRRELVPTDDLDNVTRATKLQGSIEQSMALRKVLGPDATIGDALRKLDFNDPRIKAQFGDFFDLMARKTDISSDLNRPLGDLQQKQIGGMSTAIAAGGFTETATTALRKNIGVVENRVTALTDQVSSRMDNVSDALTKTSPFDDSGAVADNIDLDSPAVRGLYDGPNAPFEGFQFPSPEKMSTKKKLLIAGVITYAVVSPFIFLTPLWIQIDQQRRKDNEEEDLADELEKMFLKIMVKMHNEEINYIDAISAIQLLIDEAEDAEIPVPKEFEEAVIRLKAKIKKGVELSQEIADGNMTMEELYEILTDQKLNSGAPGEEEEESFWDKYWWVFLIVGIVFFLIIVGIVIFLAMRKKGKTTTTKTTNASRSSYTPMYF